MWEIEGIWEHLLDMHLNIQLACWLAWHLKIILVHGKDIWLEFHLAHCLDWWLALEKDILLAYNWYFQLDTHLILQILELIFQARWRARLLGCGLDLKRSGVVAAVYASRIYAKIISGG